MNLKEAYSILEISPDSSPDEAKKRYRKLTKLYHPDVNKEPDAEAKFKKINEAYQVVSSGKSTDREDLHWQNHYNPFGGQIVEAENIQVSTTISFKESILGCNKEIKISRKSKCKNCQGRGVIPINNGCKECGGKGQTVSQRGNMVITQTCDTCRGRVQVETCKNCNGAGMLNVDSNINVSIPPGIPNNSTLRLSGFGHFMGNFMMIDQYTDAHLHVTVTPEEGLALDGKDVVYRLELSLLDALKGCDREVKTIQGTRSVQIPPLSRHKEEVIIQGLGVAGKGNQRVVLDVTYPQDTNNLIDVLNKSLSWKVN